MQQNKQITKTEKQIKLKLSVFYYIIETRTSKEKHYFDKEKIYLETEEWNFEKEEKRAKK